MREPMAAASAASSQEAATTPSLRPPPWEQPGWGGHPARGGTTSSRRTEANAGHGSQRVQNKAGKYTYKQHNKWGNPQQRPPQLQDGPGWGILFQPRPRPPTTGSATPSQQPAGDTGTDPPHQQPAQPMGDKAYNEAKAKFAAILNLHLLPRDSRQPPAPTDGDNNPPSDPTAASSHQHPGGTTSMQHAADPDATPHPSTPAASRDICADTPDNDIAETFSAEERAMQAEWAASQDGCFAMEDDDIPPHVPLSANSHADMTQLAHGCWQVSVEADTGVYIQRVAGLPRAVLLNDAGPVLTAPPLPIGTVAVFSPLTADYWLLTVEQVPLISRYEGGAMLLAPGTNCSLSELATGGSFVSKH